MLGKGEIATLVMRTKNLRILGITFTNTLLWIGHVNMLLNKISKVNNLGTRKGLHIDVVIDIYRALAHGTVTHGITIFEWTTKKNESSINSALNDCFRTATGLFQST